MGEGTDRVRSRQGDDDLYYVSDANDFDEPRPSDIEQTRAEMSETIDAIQEKLASERLSDEAREVAAEVSEEAQAVVNEAVEKLRSAFPELSGQAEQAARDVITHALQEAKQSLPVLSEQAQGTVDHIVEHAIQEAKVALQELGTQARASVRDATIGKVERMADTTSQSTKTFSSNVVSTMKQNPGPAALTALGIGWLVMNGSGGGQGVKNQTSGTAGSTVPNVTGTAQAKAGEAQDMAGDMAGDVKNTASDAADKAQNTVTNTTDDVLHTASDAANQVQHTAGAAVNQVENTAGQVANQVQSTAGQVSNTVQSLPSKVKQMVNTNPVPVSLVAVALGSVAALTVPETKRERELLGGARDKLFDQAQTAAVDVVEKAKTVAEEAGETVEKEAKYQGLSTEDK